MVDGTLLKVWRARAIAGNGWPGEILVADRDVVVVAYLDLEGAAQTVEAVGLLAVCLQHEIDHLRGQVFVEHLSQLKQLRIRNKLAKQARITA